LLELNGTDATSVCVSAALTASASFAGGAGCEGPLAVFREAALLGLDFVFAAA
jgi:hypothetical protein